MIRIENLNVHLDEFRLTDINLTVRQNEFFILMGPTGAGKTVLLEAVAGLIPVKSGKIIIGNTNVTKLPPERRGMSIVYQDYALFPHFTVQENITYGLHFHRIGKQEQKQRLKKLVDQLNLTRLLHRRPATLSGGELQRVSLARALIIEPSVLLLDEPLSALDPGFREEIRMHLKQLHSSSGVTFIMVTHDFAEALSLAETAAVIHNGKIAQSGSISEIFEKPCSAFVADFVGIKNIFYVEYEKTAAITGDIEIETGREWPENHGYIAIRPEDIVLSRSPFASSMRNSFQGKVGSVSDKGFFYEVGVRVGKVFFTSLVTKKSLYKLRVHEGAAVYLAFKATAIHRF